VAAYDYDLIVIGSGPAGQRAAIQAAKLDKSVAVLERLPMLGGVDVNTGTASKTLREAVLHLTGFRERNIYGDSYSVKQNITMGDLMVRTGYVMQQQVDMLRVHFLTNQVEMINAEGSFVDRHTINLSFPDSRLNRAITSDKVIIAVGSLSTTPPIVYVDGRLIFVSDDVLNLPNIPRSLTVVGGGAIGLEYCSTFAALGVRVTLVDRNPRLLQFADDEIVDTLVYHLRQNGVTLRLNENVNDIEYVRDHRGDRVRVMLESGKQIISDSVMYCVGRTGNTANLNLEAAGIQVDGRGRISVDDHYQTCVEGIYAVGGVIGFPDLTSTSRMQGRLAACHAFEEPIKRFPDLFPYTVRTIPELAMIGKTESQLTDAGVSYEIGKANYQETMSSVMQGDNAGMLKLLFDTESRKILGVHILGEDAAELIHIGQAVMAHGGTVDYFTEAVISYPSLAECYATAALNGINRLDP
jgi:NAD(P) transhydrogenase